jgi:hypothetical protein
MANGKLGTSKLCINLKTDSLKMKIYKADNSIQETITIFITQGFQPTGTARVTAIF